MFWVTLERTLHLQCHMCLCKFLVVVLHLGCIRIDIVFVILHILSVVLSCFGDFLRLLVRSQQNTETLVACVDSCCRAIRTSLLEESPHTFHKSILNTKSLLERSVFNERLCLHLLQRFNCLWHESLVPMHKLRHGL